MHEGVDAVIGAIRDDAERIRFLELCEPRSADDLASDGDRVTEHVVRVERLAAGDPTIDAPTARRIGDALLSLIAAAHRLEHAERRLLTGAIAYFTLAADGADDFGDLSGIDDDARVVRAVCRALGRHDLAARI